jgi:hypothetical protein
MKKVLIICICLFSISCTKGGTSEGESSNSNAGAGQALATDGASPLAGRGAPQPTGPITFNLVQPVGQKSDYESNVVMKMRMDNPAPNQPPLDFVVNLGMNLQTEVTAANPDGTWTVANRVSNLKQDATMNGRPMPIPGQASGVEGKTYQATFDKDGKLIGVTGLGDSQAEQSAGQIIQQMNPAQFLPDHPVQVGDTWPINFDMPMANAGAGPAQSIVVKGTGKLTGVINGQAKIDYDLAIEMGGQFSATGSGKSNMTYDLERARMSSYMMRFNMEMAGSAPAGGNTQQVKGNVNMVMQMGLRN